MQSPDILRIFGRTLRDLREGQTLSQEEFAKKAGISRPHLTRIENGLVNPSLALGFRLCQALGLGFGEVGAEIDRRIVGLTADAERMLPDRILLVIRNGRMNLAGNDAFLMNIFGAAKRLGARKILLDLSGLIYEFTREEEYKGAMDALKIFEQLNYQPEAVAVVATFSSFGTSVAADHGVNVRMFRAYEAAMAWLKSLLLKAVP